MNHPASTKPATLENKYTNKKTHRMHLKMYILMSVMTETKLTVTNLSDDIVCVLVVKLGARNVKTVDSETACKSKETFTGQPEALCGVKIASVFVWGQGQIIRVQGNHCRK